MIYLKKADMNDLMLLYEWANDRVVRQNSFNQDLISLDNHKLWFNRILNDPSVLLYILMKSDSPIGQIRLNICDDFAEISYSISSDYRGFGYGNIILDLVENQIKNEDVNIRRLIAKVKPENDRSMHLFDKCGFSKKYVCYEKLLNE